MSPKIELPDTIGTMGHAVFMGCKSLTDVKLPKYIKRLGYSTFRDCKSLKKIDIPEMVGLLWDGAFAGCSNLESIEFPKSVVDIETEVFSGCSKLTKIELPDITWIHPKAFEDCVNLTYIKIPESVNRIADNAFINCPKLTIYGNSDTYAETYANENNIPFVDIENIKLTNTSSISSTSISLGKTLTLNGSATGRKAPYQYAVYYRKSGDSSWKAKQKYSENSTVSIKPVQAADYEICVKVKDSSGTEVKKYFSVRVN